MKSISIFSLALLLAACGSKMMELSNADAERGAVKFPGLTVAALTQGKTHYETHCQSCHGLYSPASRTEPQWRGIVPNMVIKANKKMGKMGMPIDSAVQESILRYVVTMSSAPKSK